MKRKRNTIPESDDDASFVNNSDYSVLDKSHTQQTLDGPFDVHKSESEHSIGETNESKMISHNTLETSTNTQLVSPKDTNDLKLQTDLNIENETDRPVVDGSDPVPSKILDAPTSEAKMYSSPLSLNTHDSIAQDTKITQEKRNEPRLVINRLVLTDFKSYAGKKLLARSIHLFCCRRS